MQDRPKFVDRHALERNRRRAQGMASPVTFLHEEAITEIKERLSFINKSFSAPVIVTGRPDLWSDVVPKAKVLPDADILDLEKDAHDLVIHAMTLHWADDSVGQLVQCRRALRPDGLFLGVMFGGQTLVELRSVLAEAETKVTGGLSPRITPMAEIRDLGGLLQRGGFALPVVDGAVFKVAYSDIFHLMTELRAMGEGNALQKRLRQPTRRSVFTQASKRYAQAFPAPENRIEATFELMFLCGWVPHESQQKPLRPGSATARLADALGSKEVKLPK